MKELQGKSKKLSILIKVEPPTKSIYNGCTPFEIKVYECVTKIPRGQTRSYKWVAKKIGNPKATRAVAQALKHNPWPFIIPCHRVVNSDGTIGGYVYGTSLKQLLLSLERK